MVSRGKEMNLHSISNCSNSENLIKGSLGEFGRLMDWDQKSVLYFGDQLNADLAEPSLRFGWRTAAILPELSTEIDI